MIFKDSLINGLLVVFGLVCIAACKPEGKPIVYGEDKCEFCRMSIVDNQFGCEVVTQKAKVYKFDAVECMVNYLDQRVEDESKIKLMLTNTFDVPGSLNDADKCLYLISENMPSPMGMYLNPFLNTSEATKFQKENSGKIYNWDELRTEFKAMN